MSMIVYRRGFLFLQMSMVCIDLFIFIYFCKRKEKGTKKEGNYLLIFYSPIFFLIFFPYPLLSLPLPLPFLPPFSLLVTTDQYIKDMYIAAKDKDKEGVMKILHSCGPNIINCQDNSGRLLLNSLLIGKVWLLLLMLTLMLMMMMMLLLLLLLYCCYYCCFKNSIPFFKNRTQILKILLLFCLKLVLRLLQKIRIGGLLFMLLRMEGVPKF